MKNEFVTVEEFRKSGGHIEHQQLLYMNLPVHVRNIGWYEIRNIGWYDARVQSGNAGTVNVSQSDRTWEAADFLVFVEVTKKYQP